MPFQPLNSEHAIQAVTFTVALDGPVHTSAINLLRNRADLISELPAVQTPDVFELSPGAIPVPRRIGGVQFSHLRPDGSPAWALRLFGAELVVECTRYTRWDRVWETAERYLQAGLQDVANASSKSKRNVAVIALNYVDAFTADNQEYRLDDLIKPSALIAGKAFEAGAVWHSHIGWFEKRESGASAAWLNQLNLDARRSDPNPPGTSPKLRIEITHNQEYRFNPAISINEAEAKLSSCMKEMHAQNKLILSMMLVDEMAKRIGLGE
nr:TIGR04255 family protein [Pseudorhodoplanes sp.]